LGDPAGIGPELILKSVALIRDTGCIQIYGNTQMIKKTAQDLGLHTEFRKVKNTIIDCVKSIKYQYGKPTKATGKVAMDSINAAIHSESQIIITPPIVKEVIRLTIPDFTGHTEYLAHRYGVTDFAMVGLWRATMTMLLTTHLPLKYVFKQIRPLTIVKKIKLLDQGLKKYLNITHPMIGVSSLNPHGFEFSLGEDEKIKEGIVLAKRSHINVSGPYPADTLFNRTYDGYLTMYHDQAMIFLKSKKVGLNFTLGLPIIRLSPLYGAAVDIAGRNLAESAGMVSAIKTGIKLYKNARKHEQTTQ
jgi:4-hydroxythreonine-4-phosphate dehydrogenase